MVGNPPVVYTSGASCYAPRAMGVPKGYKFGKPKHTKYPQIQQTVCAWCQAPMTITDADKLCAFRRVGRAYCSPACGKDGHRRFSQAHVVTDVEKARSSLRMRERNPMRDPVTREKMRVSMRLRGCGPAIRGGNGHGPTVPEQALAFILGWPTNVIVPIGPRLPGYPTHYKIDIGNPTLKIAIEVDGQSHNALSRKQADKKKAVYLNGHGWTVLRFS